MIIFFCLDYKKSSGNGRTTSQHSKQKVIQKRGFDAFRCSIPQSIVLHCKEFIKNNKEWDRSLMAEMCWKTVNMIVYGRGDSVLNRDPDGCVLGDALEKILEILLKRDTISMGESMKYTGLIQKLNKQGGEKSKKRHMEKRTSTLITKRRRSVTPAYESDKEVTHHDAKSVQDGYRSDQDRHHKQRNDDKVVEDEIYDDDCSDYEIDGDERDEGHDSEKQDLGNQTNILILQTPHYQKASVSK